MGLTAPKLDTSEIEPLPLALNLTFQATSFNLAPDEYQPRFKRSAKIWMDFHFFTAMNNSPDLSSRERGILSSYHRYLRSKL